MSEDATLVELLRSTELTNGSISLRRIQGGKWSAVIAHNRHGPDHMLDHMVHPHDQQSCDPVEALRVALIEDERRCRDLRRRYGQAPKLGAAVAVKSCDACEGLSRFGCEVCDPKFDMDDILG